MERTERPSRVALANRARLAAKRAVEQHLGVLWKDRRAEGIQFAEEGWGIWYTRESARIRASELRETAATMLAALPHDLHCQSSSNGCDCTLSIVHHWLLSRADTADQDSRRSL
jgi:hypothetical protein